MYQMLEEEERIRPFFEQLVSFDVVDLVLFVEKDGLIFVFDRLS